MIDKLHHVADLFPVVLQNILDRYGKPPELPLTYLPSISRKIHGLRKKKLCIVAGRPSQGKSTLMLNMAQDLALSGHTVVLVSLEMTAEECVERMIATQGIDNFDLLTGNIAGYYGSLQGIISEFYGKLQKSKLIIVEGKGKTFAEINKIIVTLNQNIDAVFIDYVQLIVTPQGNDDKQAIDNYIKLLRADCIKRNYALILGSQINRATHEQHKLRKPELWELKGCIHPDSMIGDKTISQIYKEKDYSPIESQYNGKIVNVNPIRLIDSGVKDCLKITTKSGKSIILSRDTMLHTKNGWEKSGYLSVGDNIYVRK